MLVKTYYLLKPLIPRNIQIASRRSVVSKKRKRYWDIWPINKLGVNKPDDWPGWPDQKKFALVLTHDVDTARGQDRCHRLIELENKCGFRSAFNFVPERYQVSSELRAVLDKNGFEVGVHGLIHDGKLYNSSKIFNSRAKKINRYLKDWKAIGFRSPVMQHNLEWISQLNIEYDASTFDTDPFEPQADGVNTIFPFWVNGSLSNDGYLELPYTLPQDFTLFILMQEKNIDIWKKKIDWIVEKGGMALVNVHPDYINFENTKCALEEYPAQYYEEFLNYINYKYAGQYWHVLPKEISRFWKSEFCDTKGINS